MAKATARPARRPADRYHHGDLRRALVREAVRTIQTLGAEALTLRGVGDRLGVSRTALYRHFADKQALLEEVADDGFRMLRAALLDAWSAAGQGREGLDAMGLAYVRFALAHPSHYRVMFGGLRERRAKQPPGAAGGAGPDAGGDAFQVLVDAIAAEQAAGRLRADPAPQLALYVWGVVHGIAMLALDGLLPPGLDGDAFAPFVVERLHTGIAARP
jgi:AcrR family transcriptional regulator